jgi:hypothetical protein
MSSLWSRIRCESVGSLVHFELAVFGLGFVSNTAGYSSTRPLSTSSLLGLRLASSDWRSRSQETRSIDSFWANGVARCGFYDRRVHSASDSCALIARVAHGEEAKRAGLKRSDDACQMRSPPLSQRRRHRRRRRFTTQGSCHRAFTARSIRAAFPCSEALRVPEAATSSRCEPCIMRNMSPTFWIIVRGRCTPASSDKNNAGPWLGSLQAAWHRAAGFAAR